MESNSKPQSFCTFVILTVLSVLEVKPTKSFSQGHEVSVWSAGQKYNKTSGILYSKVGSRLELNCSLTNNKSGEIEWKVIKKGLSVSTVRLRHTSFIQYKIDKVTWELNETVLLCKTSSLRSEAGVKVTVIVGDLPSEPRDLSRKIYGIILFKVVISWKHALNTGGLPAYYKVSYNPCHNETCIPHADKHLFCRLPHVAGHDKYSCSMLRDNIVIRVPTLPFCEKFRVTIVTANEIGVSDAVSMMLNLGYGGESPFMPTPIPPSDLNATANENHITVRWKERKYNRLYDSKYIIHYHAEGGLNKTEEISKQNKITLTGGINYYTKYYIYLMVEVNSENKSQTSKAIGPVTTTTDQGVPEQGPRITNYSSTIYKNNSEYRDVVLFWEEPKKSSWQGKPSAIRVHYTKTKNQSEIKHVILPVSRNKTVPRRVTLNRLNSKDDYEVFTTKCNTKTCGAMGQRKLVKSAIQQHPSASSKYHGKTNQDRILGVILGVVALIIAILIIVLKMSQRLKRTMPEPPLDQVVPADLLHPSSAIYEDPDDTSKPNKYREVFSQCQNAINL